MPSAEFYRLLKPLPECIAYRNARLFFVIKKGFGEHLAIYACRVDEPLTIFRESEYGDFRRTILVSAENQEILRRLTEEIGFCPECDNPQRIMRSLARAGYAVRV